MKKILRLLVSSLLLFPGLHLLAQIGGDNTYEFLNLTTPPRVAAMGGDFLAIDDGDLMLAPSNPSLINPEMHNQLGASYTNYFNGLGVGYGFATYSRTFSNLGSFAATIQNINYGEFDRAEATGEKTGKFYAGESALNVGWGRSLDSNFSIGSNLKLIYSSLESYTSFGLAVDVAGSYTSNDGSFTASLIAKNIGRQVVAYDGGNIEPLPFELQAGLSKRLMHLPFRYSILVNHLNNWKLRYDDPNDQNIDPISGEVIAANKFEDIANELMLHLTFGGELLISKNFSLRAGYDYKRRQELKIQDKTSMVGFSWGFGIRISKFQISYARSQYNLAGTPNFIAITTRLSDFYRQAN